MVWTIKEDNLYEAIKNGSISEINQAIKNGADVNAKANDGCTPLMYACENNASKEVIELLINNKAKVNAKDNDDCTPLMYACMYNASKEVIELLINNKAKVNKKDAWGRTPLMDACRHNNASKEVIELLIAKGADVNEKDNDGWTPLMLAKEFKAPKEVIELLEKKIIEAAQFAALKKANVTMKQELAVAEQKNANLQQKIDEQNAQIARINFEARKRKKQRMMALRLGQYRHR